MGNNKLDKSMKRKGNSLLVWLVLSLVLLSTAACRRVEGRRVVFVGDSVTDGAWGRSNGLAVPSGERNQKDLNHIYGHSYMMLLAAWYESQYPQAGFEFFNRGISGDDLPRLAARWDEDVLSLQPEVLSIQVGINDVCRHCDKIVADSGGESAPSCDFDLASWETQYRQLLDRCRQQDPSTRFVLIAPFIVRAGRMASMPDFDRRRQLTEQLGRVVADIASDYDAVLIPAQELFDDLLEDYPAVEAEHWVWDGIHPTAAGHRRLADLWQRRVSHII